jgi:hypothetical protein
MRRERRPTREPKMTTLRIRTIQAGLILACAVSISALSSTSSFAFSAEAQQMCTGDAFRLCSSEIPNIPKITACMYKNRSNLSAGCRTVMDRDLAAQKGSKVAAE